jgi:hypothetical protein
MYIVVRVRVNTCILLKFCLMSLLIFVSLAAIRNGFGKFRYSFTIHNT